MSDTPRTDASILEKNSLPPGAYMSDYELADAEEMRQLERELTAAIDLLNNLRWKSIDKDNMEFQCTVTCYEMDAIRAKGGNHR